MQWGAVFWTCSAVQFVSVLCRFALNKPWGHALHWTTLDCTALYSSTLVWTWMHSTAVTTLYYFSMQCNAVRKICKYFIINKIYSLVTHSTLQWLEICKCGEKNIFISVLLSTHVERFIVSRMRDLFYIDPLGILSWTSRKRLFLAQRTKNILTKRRGAPQEI